MVEKIHKTSYKTEDLYDNVIKKCQKLFLKKTKDYGAPWIVFRLPSLTDQILIKAKRIKKLEQTGGRSMIPESVDIEYQGIVNYCVMALIKLWYPNKIPSIDAVLNKGIQADIGVLRNLYLKVTIRTKELMCRKNHDYGEAWKDMRLASITDQVLVKILRVKWIEMENNKLFVSEDIDAQYSDILNYCVFALIKLEENENKYEATI